MRQPQRSSTTRGELIAADDAAADDAHHPSRGETSVHREADATAADAHHPPIDVACSSRNTISTFVQRVLLQYAAVLSVADYPLRQKCALPSVCAAVSLSLV